MKKQLHTWYSLFLWVLWAVGLGATAISKFQYSHENEQLFWHFVLPYNDIVHIASYIPVAPIFFLLAFIQNKRENKPTRGPILLFLFTALYWIAYLYLYIRWTE